SLLLLAMVGLLDTRPCGSDCVTPAPLAVAVSDGVVCLGTAWAKSIAHPVLPLLALTLSTRMTTRMRRPSPVLLGESQAGMFSFENQQKKRLRQYHYVYLAVLPERFLLSFCLPFTK
ncbi:MAG: hypothetical protein CO132_05935, partial [Candidatus Kerfeldbacteria bacterium CG_4_9_14_3_um_filter_45_8]